MKTLVAKKFAIAAIAALLVLEIPFAPLAPADTALADTTPADIALNATLELEPAVPVESPVKLIEVARSERQWTGVTLSREGRIFVNYPRWSDSVTFSVGEIGASGEARPFPDRRWNNWNPSLAPEQHFICVQSVYVDRDNFLWIVDAANPKFQGAIANGIKLVQVDLSKNEVVSTIHFDDSVAPLASYLNDVRIDTERNYAYLTDSELGALIVVNLTTGESRRLLDNSSTTEAENIALVIEGKKWRSPDGKIPQVHSDGLALDLTGDYLYFQALSGRSLYRIETKWLRDESLSEAELEEKVEFLARTGAADGIEFAPDGYVYISALEDNAIKRYSPEGKLEIVVQDDRLAWPDSFAIGPDNSIYVTTSQIHRGANPPEPYRIFKLRLGE